MAFFGRWLQSLSFYFLLFVIIVSSLFFAFYAQKEIASIQQKTPVLKVLSYSTFIKNWGPGPEIAKEFEQKYQVRVQWLDAGNAGLILHALRRYQQEIPDVVLGLDSLSLAEARSILPWRVLSSEGVKWSSDFPQGMIFSDFLPFDWSPMSFLFRRGQLDMPHSLKDFLKKEYANSLAIQDPTTSTSGMYFLLWIISVYGEDEGFRFLKNLKPSVRLVAPSWSAAYSLFRNNQVPMVFSFFTSTIYHYINDGDYRYQPIYFDEPLIYSVEYIGIPQGSKNFAMANKFVHYLLTESAQKKIMEKNYMLPVVDHVKEQTPFDFTKSIPLIDATKYMNLVEKKREFVDKWKEINL